MKSNSNRWSGWRFNQILLTGGWAVAVQFSSVSAAEERGVAGGENLPAQPKIERLEDVYLKIGPAVKALAESSNPKSFQENYEALVRANRDPFDYGSIFCQVVYYLYSTGVPSTKSSTNAEQTAILVKLAGADLGGVYRKAYQYRKDPGCREISRDLALTYSNISLPVDRQGVIDRQIPDAALENMLSRAIQDFGKY